MTIWPVASGVAWRTLKNVITTPGPFGEIVGGKDCVNLGSRKVTNKTLISSL